MTEQQLMDLPYKQLHVYMEINWIACESKPWLSNKHEKAYREFAKAKKLVKQFESQYTAAEENILTRQDPNFSLRQVLKPL